MEMKTGGAIQWEKLETELGYLRISFLRCRQEQRIKNNECDEDADGNEMRDDACSIVKCIFRISRIFLKSTFPRMLSLLFPTHPEPYLGFSIEKGTYNRVSQEKEAWWELIYLVWSDLIEISISYEVISVFTGYLINFISSWIYGFSILKRLTVWS